MDEAVYRYLLLIGFTIEEIDEIEKNDYIWEASKQRTEYIVNFFLENGLTMDDIHEYFMSYPNIISEHPHRLLDVDRVLNKVGLTNEEKRKLILNNYELYSSNPDELQKIVDYLMEETIEKTVQNIFMNSKLIAENYDEIKGLLNKNGKESENTIESKDNNIKNRQEELVDSCCRHIQFEKEIKEIQIKEILPNRFTPRNEYHESRSLELVESIRKWGVLEPIIVRRLSDRFETINGERRVRAAKEAGLTTIPAIIVDGDSVSADDLCSLASVMNYNQERFDLIDEVVMYQTIAKVMRCSVDKLGPEIGIPQSRIDECISLVEDE